MKLSVTNLYTALGGSTNSSLYRSYAHFMESLRLKLRRWNLRHKGVEILKSYHKACDEAGIKCWLDFGTLLGAYREKGFIAHDFDLDVSMMAEDYNDKVIKCLIANGFVLDHEFFLVNKLSGEKLICEATYKYKGFPIDIFFNRVKDGRRQCYVFIIEDELAEDERAVNLYEFDPVENLEDLYVYGNRFNGPTNTVNVLETIYGSGFMIPDPNWQTASPKNKRVHRLDISEYFGKCVKHTN